MIRAGPAKPWARPAACSAIALVFLAMLWPERGYVPIWDGRVYADCAIHAARAGLTVESLRCAAHPSQAYAALLALPQLLRPGDVRLLHLVDALLGLLALACIRLALRRVFPEPGLARDLDLVTLACAVHPVVLSTLLQVNIDFGVYVFFFATLAALLEERFGLTVVAGLFLCFSKESGVLAYGLLVGLDALFRAAARPGGWRARSARALRSWVTVLPLVAFVVHVRLWNASHADPAVWKHGWQRQTIDGFKFFDLSDPIFVSYAAGLFVLGFLWVPTSLILADAGAGGLRMLRRAPPRPVPGADRGRLAFLTVLTVVLTYLLTSFRTWSNLRYFALLYPLFVFLAYAAILRLGATPRTRRAALAAMAALFFLAAYRSVDPVSRLVYGTFPIGERDMYRMASITGEYGGPGRDELVYNLEFTGYHHVQNALFRRVRPGDSTVFIAPSLVRWSLWSPLDSLSLERTLRAERSFSPRYGDEASLDALGHPRELWFLEFSNRPDRDATLGHLLRSEYLEREGETVAARGHVLVAHHLVRREPHVLP